MREPFCNSSNYTASANFNIKYICTYEHVCYAAAIIVQ